MREEDSARRAARRVHLQRGGEERLEDGRMEEQRARDRLARASTRSSLARSLRGSLRGRTEGRKSFQ